MAGGALEPHSTRLEQKALRTLAKAGCDDDVLALITAHFHQCFPAQSDRARRLSEIAGFATTIGDRAARDYFRAIRETQAVRELTGEAVLRFARSVDRHTAEWYFWALWGTKAVPELTSPRFLQAVEFFRSIGDPATVEYFLAIRETNAAAELTDDRVLAFAQSIGGEAAVEYFGSFWETRAVPELTSPRVLEFAQSMGSDASKEYFLAIRETKAVRELTDEKVTAFAVTLGRPLAGDYFRTVRQTKAAVELTHERVRLFAESIGKGPAEEYFRALGSTKRVAELTNPSLLEKASGVIRAIGSDAALDYFLAVAATEEVPLPSDASGEGMRPGPTETVPVLTLLNVPTYDRYRPATLAGMSVFFWWGVWQFGSLGAGSVHGWVDIAVWLVGWILLLCAAYFLLGAVVEHATEEFLKQRRRLLNEHGIRWHDCFAGDRRCEVCWTAEHTHEDERYDYGRFCRCPAC